MELARRIGLDWDYDTPRMVFNEMKMSMRSLHHITWTRLETEGAVTYPCLSMDDPGQPVVFGDGFPRRAGRQSSHLPASHHRLRCRTKPIR